MLAGAAHGAVLLGLAAATAAGVQLGLWSGAPVQAGFTVSAPVAVPPPPAEVITQIQPMESPPAKVTVHVGAKVGDCTRTFDTVYFCPQLTTAPAAPAGVK